MICFCCLVIVGGERCHLLVYLFVCDKGQFEDIRTGPVLGLSKMKAFLSGGHHKKFQDWSIFGKAVCSENGKMASWAYGSWWKSGLTSVAYVACFRVFPVTSPPPPTQPTPEHFEESV